MEQQDLQLKASLNMLWDTCVWRKEFGANGEFAKHYYPWHESESNESVFRRYHHWQHKHGICSSWYRVSAQSWQRRQTHVDIQIEVAHSRLTRLEGIATGIRLLDGTIVPTGAVRFRDAFLRSGRHRHSQSRPGPHQTDRQYSQILLSECVELHFHLRIAVGLDRWVWVLCRNETILSIRTLVCFQAHSNSSKRWCRRKRWPQCDSSQ